MRNIQPVGNAFRAAIMRNGSRVSKTFDDELSAQQWLTEMRKIPSRARGLRKWPPHEAPAVRAVELATALPAASNLLDADQIVGWARAHVPRCGVYFLVKEGAVVYVGQSVNVDARLRQHAGRFDSVFVLHCEPSELCHLESAYIAKLNTPLNKGFPMRMKACRAIYGDSR